MEQATLRTAPNSTYKIYDALFGLEEGVIAPDDSFMAWDGTNHPFETWNGNQDLFSAMQSSVNWYFEEIDKQIGSATIQNYIRKIGYGNENIGANLSSYWMQGALKLWAYLKLLTTHTSLPQTYKTIPMLLEVRRQISRKPSYLI